VVRCGSSEAGKLECAACRGVTPPASRTRPGSSSQPERDRDSDTSDSESQAGWPASLSSGLGEPAGRLVSRLRLGLSGSGPAAHWRLSHSGESVRGHPSRWQRLLPGMRSRITTQQAQVDVLSPPGPARGVTYPCCGATATIGNAIRRSKLPLASVCGGFFGLVFPAANHSAFALAHKLVKLLHVHFQTGKLCQIQHLRGS
jgi:hypothetical protein